MAKRCSFSSPTPKPVTRRRAGMPTSLLLGIVGVLAVFAGTRLPTTRPIVPESEPNDSTAAADVVAVGDVVTGSVDPANDVDVFAVTLPGNVILNIDPASNFPARIVLIDTDGTTPIDSADDFASLPPLRTYIATPGTYYLALSNLIGTVGTYTLPIDTSPVGPGDPTTLYATGMTRPRYAVAGPAGELYVVTDGGDAIRRVDPDGSVATHLSGTDAIGVALDGFGELLITWVETPGVTYGIRRSVGGAAPQPLYQFPRGVPNVAPVVGPNGDIWVITCANDCVTLHHLDPFGAPLDTTHIPEATPGAGIAFSPAGDLHYTGFSATYRVRDGVAQSVAGIRGSLAFDANGNLYASGAGARSVRQYNPVYQPLNVPFASTNLGATTSLVFARAPDGTMTNRLLVANWDDGLPAPWAGAIVEMNPAGAGTAGQRVGVDLLPVLPGTLAPGLVGTPYADTLTVDGAPGPMTWTEVYGSMAPGLSFDSASGIVSGTPSTAGSFTFTVRAEGGGRFAIGRATVAITEPSVELATLTDALLGVSGAVTPEQERFLDLRGNANGRLDVGDLRAFLILSGELHRAGLFQPPSARRTDR